MSTGQQQTRLKRDREDVADYRAGGESPDGPEEKDSPEALWDPFKLERSFFPRSRRLDHLTINPPDFNL